MNSTITANTAKNHLIFWLVTFAAFMGFVWLFGDILLPFILGFAIAYLLNPFMEYLGSHKVPRWIAALLILSLFFLVVLLLIAVIAPPLYREAVEFSDAIPMYIEKISDVLTPYIGWLQDRFGNEDLGNYQQMLQSNIGKALKVSGSVAAGLASGGQAFVGFVSVTVLTPLVAFFMMSEWKTMTDWFDKLLPRHSYDTIKDIWRQIDRKLAGFVRGQLTVALCLAIIYALALTFAGLKFGFMIGLMSGLLSIVPLFGSIIGLIVSVGVAWFQTGEWSFVGLIAGIFLVGQFVEGNFLTPKLLGKSVGLHPLWILFALLAGGSLFGVVGMLLAVPVAASVGVLMAFGISRYKESPYYKHDTPAKKTARKSTKKSSKKTAKK